MGGIYVGKEALEYMREKTKNNCSHQHLKRIGVEVIFKCKDCGKVISKGNRELPLGKIKFRLFDEEKQEVITNTSNYCISLDGTVCFLNSYGLVPMKNITWELIKEE